MKKKSQSRSKNAIKKGKKKTANGSKLRMYKCKYTWKIQIYFLSSAILLQ